MKKKKKIIIIIVVAAIVLVALVAGIAYAKGYFNSGMGVCPSAWIDNQMPPKSSRNTQYLVIDGVRHETSEYNLDWIRSNCEVNEPSVAY